MDGTTRHKFIFNLISLIVFLPFGHSDRIMRMIQRGDAPCEKHTVETDDGYFLAVHRIPQQNLTQNNSKVILLMHGISDSAETFLHYNPRNSVSFALHKAGFDVWLLNARGNIYSRHHINMTAKDANFWDFTWHEIGVYDVPATIDYILEKTNQTKLAYAGVSQGCPVILVTLSELPEYNDKISVVQLLAPAIIFKYSPIPFPITVGIVNLLGDFLRRIGITDITPNSLAGQLNQIAPLCITPYTRDLCRNIIFTIFCTSNQYFDEMVFNMSNHYPAGTSYKQFVHFAQLIATGKFHKFYYNDQKNMEIYGSVEPPEYNLSKITAHIHISYAPNDKIAPAENIPLIVDKLRSSVVTLSKFPGFNHIDFTYGRNLSKVHRKMFEVLNRYY